MRSILTTVFILLLATSCGSGDVDPAYEALVQTDHDFPSTGELGAGDKFELRVHGQEDLSGEFTVSTDGTINYPYIGKIEVSGKTCAELETAIGEGLEGEYLTNPSVLCAISEYNSKRIYLFGEVKSPGAFPYKSNISIIEAVALAGGFSERANTNGTKLSRVVNGTEIQVRVPMQEIVEGRSRNIRLLPGDIIYVPESPY